MAKNFRRFLIAKKLVSALWELNDFEKHMDLTKEKSPNHFIRVILTDYYNACNNVFSPNPNNNFAVWSSSLVLENALKAYIHDVIDPNLVKKTHNLVTLYKIAKNDLDLPIEYSVLEDIQGQPDLRYNSSKHFSHRIPLAIL